MNRLTTLLTVAALASGLSAEAGERVLADWEFRRLEPAPATEWARVTVPHDWAITGDFDFRNGLEVSQIVQNGETKATEKSGRTGALPWIGAGEYRTVLALPADAERASLIFDGAMAEPEVFFNGEKIGEWKYGYTTFELPIPQARPGLKGELVVRLRTREKSSRWYPGAGLYRPVTLRWGARAGIASFGQTILTPALDVVDVKTELVNPDQAPLKLAYRVLDAEGNVLAAGPMPLKVPGARPWSPESPTLYVLETTVSSPERVLETRRERFGFRTLDYAHGEFRLNGVRRQFRGVCLHHDLGPLGAAFSKDAFRRQVRLMKEMGADSIRTSHNHPAPGQLEVCDEEGMMVLAESFDAWRLTKCENDYHLWFDDWWQRDLTQLVRVCGSHPCVVMWSIGNEIGEQRSAEGTALMQQMQAFVNAIDADKTRPVSCSADSMPSALESGFIAAQQIPAVTYRIDYYDRMHEAAPKQGVVLGIETAATASSRGTYHFPVEGGKGVQHPDGQSSGYDVECCPWSNLPDDDWAMQESRPWLIGEFVWTGFDYLGEPTPYDEYWPSRSSYFGLCDLAGLPKDRYWLYRSHWNARSHTLHVCPEHWNFPDRLGEITPVYVYTDAEEAELFLNGRSQGRRRKDPTSRLDRYRLRWNEIRYEPGELKAVAYGKDGRKLLETVVRTAGKAVRTRVTPETYGSLRYFTVELVDAAGTVVPDDDRELFFTVRGGRFLGACNGDATSLENLTKPQMKTFRGKLVVVAEGGASELEVAQ